ncbi:hypothetical protein B0H14DRAFT_2608969 [Mycena olivaceomarginata]|nr:hypothetical protein B0H14DRAFT_2608969 [Mycena olivaceomarginata]
MCPRWFQVRDDIVIGTTETGWTNEQFFQIWFKLGFIPGAKAHSDPEFPIFLLLDGHLSHDTVESVDDAIENNPCDVGAFGPSKGNWRARCDEILQETGEAMSLADIVKEWMDVREKSFKVETIQAAWYKSGINVDASGLLPRLTPEIFTVADYAPSISTSTQLHLPVGFPLPEEGADDNVTAISGQPSDPSLTSSLPTASDPSSSTPPLPTAFTPPISYDYPQDHDEPPSDLRGEALVMFYQAVAAKLKAQRNEARAQRELADTHAIMAGQHIQSLQQKLNSGKGKKRAGNERNLSTTARMLTSAEGRVLAEEKRTAQLQKKAKDDENHSQRLLVNAEVIKRRAELGREGMEFAGNIKSLKAPQLKDLAWSLKLEENGTRDVLIDRILTHFGDDESLKVDKRYVELWLSVEFTLHRYNHYTYGPVKRVISESYLGNVGFVKEGGGCRDDLTDNDVTKVVDNFELMSVE